MVVGIIGTGVMGLGIAQVFAQSDCTEHILMCNGREISKVDPVEKLEGIYRKLISKGVITEREANKCLEKFEYTEKPGLHDADMVIEAIVEDLVAKQNLFYELDKICKESCLFATNTSSLPISKIGDNLKRPLVGMHFFNPAPIMKLVEIVATDKTKDSVINRAVTIAGQLKKQPVVVKEAPGFIVNRLLIPMINEAALALSENVARKEDIDCAMKLGANHPMGPLALADLIGIDIVVNILNAFYIETGDKKYLPCPLLARMVSENKLGRKTGEGFYEY